MNTNSVLTGRVASEKIAFLTIGLAVLSLAAICVAQDAGQVKFVNSCPYSLTFNSTGPQIGTLPDRERFLTAG
jgi:hypothetical protein